MITRTTYECSCCHREFLTENLCLKHEKCHDTVTIKQGIFKSHQHEFVCLRLKETLKAGDIIKESDGTIINIHAISSLLKYSDCIVAECSASTFDSTEPDRKIYVYICPCGNENGLTSISPHSE